MEQFVTTVALIGIVVVIASLLSGLVERSGAPLVAAFLALGLLLGPYGLDLTDVGLDSPALRALATLGLTLLLFSDAVGLELAAVRSRARLAWVLLVPGTLVPAAIVAVAAWALLDVPAAAAALLGAALSSTDPVMLRSLLRSRALPDSVRVALRLETGMNDVALLPVVVFGILLLQAAAAGSGSPSRADVEHHVVGLFLLGPGLGVLVGWVGIRGLAYVRDRFGVRRDYESLYALGLAFSSYAAAEAVGGSGFLAAFGAGLVIASQDVELCDCFLEYGEATAEMLLLLTFVALGLSLIWSGLGAADAPTLLFAGIALVARTLVLLPMLRLARLGGRDRRLIALFGPRGLGSLLLVLLPVFAGVPGAERLFAVACLVVLLSVVVHGAGIALFLRAQRLNAGGGSGPSTPSEEPAVAAPVPSLAAVPPTVPDLPERIGVEEVRALVARDERVVIVDTRQERNLRADPRQARGAVRLPPDDPVRTATELRLAQHATLVVYCA